jgi:ribosomal protein S18 acetylase RimI-like enzyme
MVNLSTGPETAGRDPDTLVVERDGELIGTVRLVPEGDRAGVYGFAVHPGHQGRGIGRDVLHRVCRTARAAGAGAVHLEVATGNDRALRLYTSLGFRPVITEDYYTLPGGDTGQ